MEGWRDDATSTEARSRVQSDLYLMRREDSRKRERRFVWHVPAMLLRNAGRKVAYAEARCGGRVCKRALMEALVDPACLPYHDGR